MAREVISLSLGVAMTASQLALIFWRAKYSLTAAKRRVPINFWLRFIADIVPETSIVCKDPPIPFLTGHLFGDVEAAYPGQGQHVAAIVGYRKTDDPSRAACLV